MSRRKTAPWRTWNNAKTKLLERKNRTGGFKAQYKFQNIINLFSSLELQDTLHKHMILYLYRKEWAFTILNCLEAFSSKKLCSTT